MPPVSLALVSQVDEIATSELRRVADALGTQIRRDFSPHWDVEATVDVYPAVTDVPLGYWPVLIQRETTAGGASLHLDQGGQPFALVAFSPDWPLAASVQCLNMLVDPFGNRLLGGPSPKEGNHVLFLVEVCQPCSGKEFGYEIDGVTVSDFVTPRYYEVEAETRGPTRAGAGFDFTGAVEASFQVLPGGFLTWYDPVSNHWWQHIFVEERPEFRDLGELNPPAAPEEEPPEPEAEDVVETAPPPADAETPLPTEPQRAGQIPGAASDKISGVDQLGFRDYVTAFVRLITSPATSPPITIGIFGSWGVGKSFLLQGIRDELESYPTGDGDAISVHVVELNAWSYSASKAVWPSLVRAVMECGERELDWPFPGRFLRKFFENLKWEIRRERGRLLGAVFAGLVLLTLTLWHYDFDVSLLTAGAAALGAVGLIKVVADTVTNPLGRWMTTVLKSSEYGEDIGYMSRIRHDLETLSNRLGERRRIVVLIDDLDRCEPDKMVEVLQAINLLLNFESFIVCLGIDARVVTRAIERHYQGLLEESNASGYEYLDKIVQIPFRIPRPSELDIESFLSAQLRNGDLRFPAPGQDPVYSPPHETPSLRESRRMSSAAVVTGLDPPTSSGDDESGSDPVAFTDVEIEAFEDLAPFLEPNPRHLKRIVNVYRLVRSLATVRLERFVLEDPAGTIRLLAIAAQWPYTLAAMFDRLDEMVEAEAKGSPWPTAEPLDHLYADVGPHINRERQSQLDRELDDLDRLFAETRGKLSWKALASLRRYIVNFNPAVEEELRVALAVEAATQSARATTPKAKAPTQRKRKPKSQSAKSTNRSPKRRSKPAD